MRQEPGQKKAINFGQHYWVYHSIIRRAKGCEIKHVKWRGKEKTPVLLESVTKTRNTGEKLG